MAFYMKYSPLSQVGGKSPLNESKSKGNSNEGEYPNVDEFCGPAGGSNPGTYPVNTLKRAYAAKSYARNAPDPAGIRACANRRIEELKG